jgi:hypothetical protein
LPVTGLVADSKHVSLVWGLTVNSFLVDVLLSGSTVLRTADISSSNRTPDWAYLHLRSQKIPI